MSKHLTGSKRLAVIQRWINGHDDPEWEVFPTRTEGKYIVKQRKTPIPEKTQETEEIEESEETPETEEIEEIEETPEIEETSETEEIEEKPRKTKKQPKPQKPQKLQKQFYDPTMGLEILNQLKLLGEEMKNQRKRKEQKRLIKEVVDKRMYKKKKYAEPEPEPVEYEQIEEVPEQMEYEIPIRMNSNKRHIFEDML